MTTEFEQRVGSATAEMCEQNQKLREGGLLAGIEDLYIEPVSSGMSETAQRFGKNVSKAAEHPGKPDQGIRNSVLQ